MSSPNRNPLLRTRKLVRLLALVSLFALAFYFHRNMERLKSPVETENPLLYLPSGKYLKIISLGYDNFLADLIYLWSIQYYGDYELFDRYPYLERIFDVITDIDPQFIDAYDFGSMIMVMDANRTEKALALLDKGIENNRDAWNLAAWAGFVCFIYVNPPDYERAARYFKLAESMEGCTGSSSRSTSGPTTSTRGGSSGNI
jgi:tetratricopeptide (TPR) repeat protein